MAEFLDVKSTGGEAVRLQLARYLGQLKDAHGYLDRLADWVAGEEKRQFKQEGGAYPPRWQQLSPRYAAWKRRHYPGKRILERTGLLKDSLTRRPFGVEVISDKAMTIGTGVEYAIYHQEGTATMPSRPVLIRLDAQFKKQAAKQLQRWIIDHNR